jgi:hypothetical protein
MPDREQAPLVTVLTNNDVMVLQIARDMLENVISKHTSLTPTLAGCWDFTEVKRFPHVSWFMRIVRRKLVNGCDHVNA